MNRTQIITICVLVLIAAVAIGWVIRHDNGTEATPTPSTNVSPTPTAALLPAASATPKPVQRTVHLTTTGPTPKTLTINAGDAVRFINDAAAQYWPVSGMCPSLNAQRGLNQGEAYTLRFPQPAICTYYNQLNTYDPAMAGTITVR